MPLTSGRARWLAIPVVAVLNAAILDEASAEPVTTIRANGDAGNRADIVILGDGYTASELAQYATDVETFVAGLLSQEPFWEYQRYFNVHRVDVISNESGADHPERIPPVSRDTALDATYNCAGIQRLICVDVSEVITILSTSVSPDMRDVVLVIVNDGEYGGSGGAVAVASVHPAVVEVILHELGHSFGLLADEYGGPPPPQCNASMEPPEPNVTKQTERDLMKWTVWIDPVTPVPTPGPTVGEPGLYEGAKYCDTGLFRSTYNSKMRSLSQPFEQINSEQLVKRGYNWVSPIDAAEPPEPALTLRQDDSQTFRVQTPEPLSQALEIVWSVDGQVTANGGEFTLNASDLTPGFHTVDAVASDLTSLVRNDPGGVLTETRRWDVEIVVAMGPELVQVAVSDPPATARVRARFAVTDIVRNDGDAIAAASTTRFYLSVDTERNMGDRRLTGRRAISELAGGEASAGMTRVRIPFGTVPGTYFLLACADNNGVVAESNEENNCRASETQITVTPRFGSRASS